MSCLPTYVDTPTRFSGIRWAVQMPHGLWTKTFWTRQEAIAYADHVLNGTGMTWRQLKRSWGVKIVKVLVEMEVQG